MLKEGISVNITAKNTWNGYDVNFRSILNTVYFIKYD
jgi:hypothetical protein